MKKITPFSFALASGFLVMFFVNALHAAPSLTHQGFSTQKDKKNRSPVLTVSVERDSETSIRILADAQIPREDAKDHPLRFDFYVNRQLVASQIRSIELPGPVGINVNPDQTPVPFNYAVMVTHIYPNGHSYSSMIAGAVFDNDLTGEMDCEISISGSKNVQASAEKVGIAQVNESGFQYSFTAESEDESDSVEVSGSVSFTSEEASGLLTYSINGDSGSTKTVSLSGDVDKADEGGLSGFSLASETGDVQIDCASSTEAALEDALE